MQVPGKGSKATQTLGLILSFLFSIRSVAMDRVKVVSVVGFLAVFFSMYDLMASERSPLRTNSELQCQSTPERRERQKGESRGFTPASPEERVESHSTSQGSGEPETLRAFESAGRLEGENVGLFVSLLLFGVVGAVIIFFVLYAIFFEPSESSRPYRPTEVKRGENFVPYQHSRPRNDLDQ